jgi:predicted lipid-binding transport protein (Tim44 family)
MMLRKGLAPKLGLAAIVAVTSFAMLASTVDARVGSGRSFGSRGSKTFTAPPTTKTAPKAAQPIDRSITQPGVSASRPTAGAVTGAASQAVRSGGLLRGLILGGFLGAGLAALLGTGGLASLLGAVLQIAWIALLIGIGVMAFRWLTGRNIPQPAAATATAGGSTARADGMMQRASVSGMGNSAPPLSIGEADFNTFEQRLYEIQDAYSRGDEKALGDRTTPEMLSYFMQEIASNRRQGVRNELRQPKLLQGDLSESWREGTMEYATVAMRFSIIDAMVDTTSGRVVSGSLDQPQEATEVWTFCRPANGRPQQWELSAIQQA